MKLSVEYAKSGRATCRTCGEKIAKDDPRWVKETETEDMLMKAYTHIACLKLQRKTFESINEQDIAFQGDFSKKEIREIIEAFRNSADRKKRSTSSPKKDENNDIIMETEPALKKRKKKKKKTRKTRAGVEVTINEKADLTKDEMLFNKYKHMTIGQLKAYLRANAQMLSGKKDELVQRCVDGEARGALPKCPRCIQGRLIKNFESDTIQCRGYFDESIGMPIRCKFVAESVKRLPWKSPDDEEAKQQSTTSKAGKKADISESLKNKIRDAFKDVQDHRTAANEMVTIAREEDIALPKNDSEARQKIGSLFMENNADGEIDYVKVFESLLQTVGTKSEINKKKDTPSAKVPENSELAALLEELAGHYAKLGGTNKFKASALKKAAINIRGLDFQVDNGKALSQGKQKVEGIGKGTGAMIDEYLETGKIAALEEFREDAENIGL